MHALNGWYFNKVTPDEQTKAQCNHARVKLALRVEISEGRGGWAGRLHLIPKGKVEPGPLDPHLYKVMSRTA